MVGTRNHAWNYGDASIISVLGETLVIIRAAQTHRFGSSVLVTEDWTVTDGVL